jgi:hypothetical protein
MKTIREISKRNGDVYQYIYDPLMDCTRVVLMSGDEVVSLSAWNTGYDSIVEMNEVEEMTDKEFRAFCWNSIESAFA